MTLETLCPELMKALQEHGIPPLALKADFGRLAIEIVSNDDLAKSMLNNTDVDSLIDVLKVDESPNARGTRIEDISPALAEVLESKDIPVIHLIGHLQFLAADIECDESVREDILDDYAVMKKGVRRSESKVSDANLQAMIDVYAAEFGRDKILNACSDAVLDYVQKMRKKIVR